MKRAAIAAVLAALFLAPAAAFAYDHFYKGQIDGGGIVEFRGVVRHDKPQHVYRFHWANVPITCTGGSSATSFEGHAFDMQVGADRSFHGNFEFNNGNATAHA